MRTTRQSAKARDKEYKKRAKREKAEKVGRQLHFPNGIWTWKVGGGTTVIIRDPHNFSYKVSVSTLTGVPWSEIERRAWKGNPQEPITPAKVRKYIQDVIMGDGIDEQGRRVR